MNYKMELTEQGAQPVLSIRKRVPVGNLPQELGAAYGSIIQYLNELGEKPAGAAFTAYYNMDMEDLDVEMGFPVSGQLEAKGDIMAAEIPEGMYASCMYKGPYAGMASAYDALNGFINEKGLAATGVSYEFYCNSPMEVPESELLTRIVFPVR